MTGLPNGWTSAKIGQITEQYQSINPRGQPNKEFQYVDIGCIDNSNLKITEPKLFLGRNAPSRARRIIREGDVLFSTVRTHLRNVAKVPPELDGQLASTGIAVLRPSNAVLSDYLFRWVSSKAFIDEISLKQDGTLYPAVRESEVKNGFIPLPPLNEQKRIAKKLNYLSEYIVRVRKELTLQSHLLDNAKLALLDRAFRGALTSNWRKTHNENIPVKEVVNLIRHKRKFDRVHVDKKQLEGVINYSLPHTWKWVSPDEIADDSQNSIGIGPFGSNLKKSDYTIRGVRLIFVRDIRAERFDDENARYISPQKAQELSRHVVLGGDLLITKMGDPPGDTAIYPKGSESAIITADCIKLRPIRELADTLYLKYAIRSPVVVEQIKNITQGIAQQKVSLGRFRQIGIPLAPIEEQKQIVFDIETAFAAFDKIAMEAECAENALDRLEESIFFQAFNGKLVPQSNSDQLGGDLLDGIQTKQERQVSKNRLSNGKREQTVKQRTQKTSLVEALQRENNPLSTKHLLECAGYPRNATTELLDEFFLELRLNLNEKVITRHRVGDEDIFSLKRWSD